MRARTVGDLRRELDGVHDDALLVVLTPDTWAENGRTVVDHSSETELDVGRVDTTMPSHVVLHAEREDLP